MMNSRPNAGSRPMAFSPPGSDRSTVAAVGGDTTNFTPPGCGLSVVKERFRFVPPIQGFGDLSSCLPGAALASKRRSFCPGWFVLAFQAVGQGKTNDFWIGVNPCRCTTKSFTALRLPNPAVAGCGDFFESRRPIWRGHQNTRL